MPSDLIILNPAWFAISGTPTAKYRLKKDELYLVIENIVKLLYLYGK